ncbi:MAG: MiaB/RimO family radical SAM methylthiotransferase [Candidatus Absconditabacterales bacterium]
MKFSILVFGCQMNYADSARIKTILLNCGFSYTEDIKQADIVIFDTCSVRQKAEDKITGTIKDLKKTQKIWITGCMIQHSLRSGKLMSATADNGKLKMGNFLGTITSKNPEIIGFTTDEIDTLDTRYSSHVTVSINNIFNPIFHRLHMTYPNLELMRRIDDTGFLPLILKKLGYKITYDQEIINEYEKIVPQGINTSMNRGHQTTAYIPISTGCNQFCSYCIVPYARGLEKNFPVKQIIDEAKIHLGNGAKEIVLLGQIVNKHPQFVEILKEILKLKGLQRLRYTSPYPTYYSDELLKLHEAEAKLCPHIHIPFQSGSDTILKAMHRGYTLAQAKKFIDDIHSLKTKISITTDIIVGFPGETEEDFQQTLDLVKYGKFDMIYIGIYSPRPGTLAQRNYPDDIPYTVKHDRRARLNEVLKKTSLENNEKEIGMIHTVLINNIEKPSTFSGYTEDMKQIIVQSVGCRVQSAELKKHQTSDIKLQAKPGDFVQARVTRGVPFKLYGKIF